MTTYEEAKAECDDAWEKNNATLSESGLVPPYAYQHLRNTLVMYWPTIRQHIEAQTDLIEALALRLSDVGAAHLAERIEQLDEDDAYEAGMAEGHKDLLVMNEDRRQHVRSVLADLFDGDFNFADRIVGTLHTAGCEIVTTDVVFRKDQFDVLRAKVEQQAAEIEALKERAKFFEDSAARVGRKLNSFADAHEQCDVSRSELA